MFALIGWSHRMPYIIANGAPGGVLGTVGVLAINASTDVPPDHFGHVRKNLFAPNFGTVSLRGRDFLPNSSIGIRWMTRRRPAVECAAGFARSPALGSTRHARRFRPAIGGDSELPGRSGFRGTLRVTKEK